MSLALWRSPLARALHLNRSLPNARYLQLATIGKDGKPANRTVVFRGFLDDQLKFVTDARSAKADQIQSQPWGEACWYFPKTREQFRIAGMLTLVRSQHPDLTIEKARQIAWQELSDAARQQFVWPHPGEAKADIAAFQLPFPDPAQALEHFCLLLLDPVQVDRLELRGDPQNRWIYQREEGRDVAGNVSTWSEKAVNP